MFSNVLLLRGCRRIDFREFREKLKMTPPALRGGWGRRLRGGWLSGVGGAIGAGR